jgi:hypothetical protein
MSRRISRSALGCVYLKKVNKTLLVHVTPYFAQRLGLFVFYKGN